MFVFKQMLHIVTVNVCQMKKTPAAQLKQHCQCKNVMGLYLHRVSTGVAVHYTNGRFVPRKKVKMHNTPPGGGKE